MKVFIKKASKGKRIVAALADVFIGLIAFFLIQVFIAQPLVSSTTDYDKYYESYYETLVDSSLFRKNNTTGAYEIIAPSFEEDYNVLASDYYDYYENKVSSFFSEANKSERYEELKENSSVFELINENYVLKENVSSSETLDFYYNAISVAKSEIIDVTDENKSLIQNINFYNQLMVYSSASISVLIFYIVLPLVFEGGQTIGKRMFNLKLVSKKTGFDLKKTDILLRQLFVGVVCILGGFFVSFIIPIIFIVTLFFTKNNQSIDDFLVSTIVSEKTDSSSEDEENILTIDIGEK